MVPVVRPSPVLAGCAALAVVLATGCGTRNGGDVKPDGDAQAVCSTLLAWRQRVPADSVRLSAELQAGSLDAQPVKDRYTAFFQAVVGRTDTMLTGIDKAGAGPPLVRRWRRDDPRPARTGLHRHRHGS